MIWTLGILAGAAALLFPAKTSATATAVTTAAKKVFGPFMPLGPTVESAAYAKAVQLLKLREGSENYAYADSKGKPTLGIGHLLSPAEQKIYKGPYLPVPRNRGVGGYATDAQIAKWFKQDVDDAFRKAKAQARELGKYTPDMIAVLTSANFQLGDFKSVFENSFSLLRRGAIGQFIANIATPRYKIENGKTVAANWAAQTPTRVQDLVNTVKKEYGVA